MKFKLLFGIVCAALALGSVAAVEADGEVYRKEVASVAASVDWDFTNQNDYVILKPLTFNFADVVAALSTARFYHVENDITNLFCTLVADSANGAINKSITNAPYVFKSGRIVTDISTNIGAARIVFQQYP